MAPSAPSAQVSLESAFLDGLDRHRLVILPRVTGDSKRANELAAVAQANQHATERRYESSVRRRRERINEVRPVLGHGVLNEPGGMAERDAGPRLSIRDFEAECARVVLALRAHHVTAAIDHAAGDGKMAMSPRDRYRGLDQTIRSVEIDRLHRVRLLLTASHAAADRGPARAGARAGASGFPRPVPADDARRARQGPARAAR